MKVRIGLLFWVLPLFSCGQDIHFSQFFHSFSFLNPAETGNFTGQTRLAYQYRNQWAAIGDPFVTNYIQAEQNLLVSRNPLSIGVAFFDDRAGAVRLQSNRLMLSLAYHLNLASQQIHFGIQGGPVLKQINLGNETFPDQFDRNTGGFSSTLPTNETVGYEPALYPDINAGVGWNAKWGKLRPKVGFAISHLNTPTETLTGASNTLPMRYVIDLRLGIQLTAATEITGIVYQTYTSTVSENLFSVLAEHTFFKESNLLKTSLFGGILYRDGFIRNLDAAILMVGLQKSKIRSAVSYDINVSSLVPATSARGAIEFSLQYIIPYRAAQLKYIPCERY